MARSTGAGAGLLILLLGIWAAIIPFVGPYFHYGFGPDATWHFTMNRLWLDILPGAVAILGGIGLIGASRRASGAFGGWLAIAAGAWLVIGPSMSMLWGHAAPGLLSSGIGAPLGGHDRAAAETIGFFYGAGALIIAFAAFAVGRFASRPALSATARTQGEREVLAREREPVREPAISREPLLRRRAGARRGTGVSASSVGRRADAPVLSRQGEDARPN
ncbi:MAG: hypothetical protein ACYCUM_13455 [Solirubrobacteraceae bacterium]